MRVVIFRRWRLRGGRRLRALRGAFDAGYVAQGRLKTRLVLQSMVLMITTIISIEDSQHLFISIVDSQHL